MWLAAKKGKRPEPNATQQFAALRVSALCLSPQLPASRHQLGVSHWV